MHLSMLAEPDDLLHKTEKELQQILNYVGELESIGPDKFNGILPLTNPLRDLTDMVTMHNDEVKDSMPVKELLKNAPDQKLNQFKIEAIIEDN